MASCTNPNRGDQKTHEVIKIFRFDPDFKTKGTIDFSQDSLHLNLGGAVDSSDSKTGKYAVRLNKERAFCGAQTIALKEDFHVMELTAWVKPLIWPSKVQVVVQDNEDSDRYYISSDLTRERDANDWRKISIRFRKFEPFQADDIKAYIWCSKGDVLVDQVSFRFFQKGPQPQPGLDTLYLNIRDAEWEKLLKVRSKALEAGVMSEDLNKYVKGTVQIGKNGPKQKVDTRLKGDWPDHWNGPKWSFRIKHRGDGNYKGMPVYNIQDPSTRGGLGEYLIHKFAERENVLTTHYDFVNVFVNGEYKGVYALEEHFRKQLVERNNRREGPILKINESLFWETQMTFTQTNVWGRQQYLTFAPIEPFGLKRILKNKTQKKLFIQGRNALHGYIFGDYKAEQVFDLDVLAKYFAIADVTHFDHGVVWHNWRLYVNPVTSKLEVILYDAFSDQELLEKDFFHIGRIDHLKNMEMEFVYGAFQNPKMRKLYFNYLKTYADSSYLARFHQDLEAEIAVRKKALEADFYNEPINDHHLWEQQEFFAKYLDQLESEYADFNTPVFDLIGNHAEETAKDHPFSEQLVKAYYDEDLNRVTVINKSSFEIHVSGLKSKKKGEIKHKVSQKIAPSKRYPFQALHIEKPKKEYPWLQYKFKGKKHYTPVLPYPAPESALATPAQKTRLADGITYVDGVYSITQDIVLKEFQNLEGSFVVGSPEKPITIRLKKGAGILVQGDVNMDHVTFVGEPGNFGLSVFNFGGVNVVQNCTFEGLSNPNFDDWSLTGAVTFYKGESRLSNCLFNNNNCEDGLNIFDGVFTMEQCTVSNTFADGFDGDFVTGTIRNSYFHHTGNDAIDFSGSRIEVENSRFENIADKAISGGEQSTIQASGVSVKETNIAVASKDNSLVRMKNSTITDSKVAYAVYCKKPEYGPAQMEVKGISLSGVEREILLDKGSKLSVDGKSSQGTESIDIDALYEPFKYQRQ